MKIGSAIGEMLNNFFIFLLEIADMTLDGWSFLTRFMDQLDLIIVRK